MSSVWNTAESLLLGAGDNSNTQDADDNYVEGAGRRGVEQQSLDSRSQVSSSLLPATSAKTTKCNTTNVRNIFTQKTIKSNSMGINRMEFDGQQIAENDCDNQQGLMYSEMYTDPGSNVSVASNVTVASDNVDVTNENGEGELNSEGMPYFDTNVCKGIDYRRHRGGLFIPRSGSKNRVNGDDDDEDDDDDDDLEEEDCESIDVCGDDENAEVDDVAQSHSCSNIESSQASGNNYHNPDAKIQMNETTNTFTNVSMNSSNYTDGCLTPTSGSSNATVRGRGRPRGNRGGGRGRGRGYLPPAVAEGLARHEAVQQQVYKQKYKEMKKIARSLVLENAALCDTVADVQQKIIIANEERRFLLRKLHALYQNNPNSKNNPFLNLDANAWSLLEGRSTAATSLVTGDGSNGSTPTAAFNNIAGAYNNNRGNNNVTGGNENNAIGAERTEKSSSSHQPPAPSKRSRGQQNGRSKSKRLCPPITLDSAGRPIFPICLGPLTIHSLGEIVSERASYHRVHVIYPVGFCSSRTYASVSNPTMPATYTCKILDAGLVPRFEIVCEEPETGEERVFSASSPSDCHNQVLTAITAAHQVPTGILTSSPESNCISDRGLRFFGLSHPSVQNVLQACPGARKCHNYQWIKFEVCRSEGEVEKVLEGERDTGLCHETLLRNIMFASQVM